LDGGIDERAKTQAKATKKPPLITGDDAVSDAPLPPSKSDKVAIFNAAMKRYHLAENAERDNRRDALDDLKFSAGDQWPASVQAERLTDGRPMLTINHLPKFIHHVTGDIRQNKPAIRVRPPVGNRARK